MTSDERLDDLQNSCMKILQKKDAFRFGTDAVLLSDFVMLRSHARVADLGTGTGIIALLLAAHHPSCMIDALEIQPEFCDMANRSVHMNQLQNRIRVVCGDIRSACNLLGRGVYDCVVCNPPYFKLSANLPPENDSRLLARTDALLTPDELCSSAFQLLKSRGRLSVVYPAQSVLDMVKAMQKNRLSPKRIRTVHATSGHAPSLVLLDAVKQGGDQLHWMNPLILKNSDGSPTEEWNRIYGYKEHSE